MIKFFKEKEATLAKISVNNSLLGGIVELLFFDLISSQEVSYWIFATVATFSFKNLIYVKLRYVYIYKSIIYNAKFKSCFATDLFSSCKVFMKLKWTTRISEGNTRRISDCLWKVQNKEKINKVTSFIELCREYRNTEALHKKGVLIITDNFKGFINVFNIIDTNVYLNMFLFYKWTSSKNDRLELALKLRKKAAKRDHIGASYVIDIIFSLHR